MPVTALTATITSAVRNVSFRACQAYGSGQASPERAQTGLGRLHAQRHQRQDDHDAQVRQGRPPQGPGPEAAIVRRSLPEMPSALISLCA